MINIVYIPDAIADQDFCASRYPVDRPLGAVVWDLSGQWDLHPSRADVLRAAMESMAKVRKTWVWWVVNSGSIWRKPTRIESHKIKKKAASLLKAPDVVVARWKDDLWTPGEAKRISQAEAFDAALKLVSESAFLVVIPEGTSEGVLEEVLNMKWDAGPMPPWEAIQHACTHGGLAGSVYGDGREMRVRTVLFGDQLVVADLAKGLNDLK